MAIYRQRNLVERFFCKLKHFRRVATRFDKLARNFLAAVLLASTRLWLRAYQVHALAGVIIFRRLSRRSGTLVQP